MPSSAVTSFSTLSLTRPFISVPNKATNCCNSWPSSQEEPFSTVPHKAEKSWICCKTGNCSIHSPSPSVLPQCNSLMSDICSLHLAGRQSPRNAAGRDQRSETGNSEGPEICSRIFFMSPSKESICCSMQLFSKISSKFSVQSGLSFQGPNLIPTY